MVEKDVDFFALGYGFAAMFSANQALPTGINEPSDLAVFGALAIVNLGILSLADRIIIRKKFPDLRYLFIGVTAELMGIGAETLIASYAQAVNDFWPLIRTAANVGTFGLFAFLGTSIETGE